MSLSAARDVSLLTHKIVDNRLVICRAIQNRGVFYDISIGVDGANFANGNPPNLDQKIQTLVRGCLHALQQQLEAQSKPVDKLDQLGFLVQKLTADTYESHALVAGVGQSVLNQIKSCPSGNYASLQPLYSGDTAAMKWTPADAGELTWVEGDKRNYSVHDGLVRLSEGFSTDLQIFGFSQSAAQSDFAARRESAPVAADAVDPLAAAKPRVAAPPSTPRPDAQRLPDSRDALAPPVPDPAIAPALKRREDSSLEEENPVLKDVYARWQHKHRKWFAGWRSKSLWDDISLDQLLQGPAAAIPADKLRAIQTAMPQLFEELRKVAPDYYRADHHVVSGAQTADETLNAGTNTLPRFYLDYLTERVIQPISAHWSVP
jgi:hypothetical protein